MNVDIDFQRLHNIAHRHTQIKISMKLIEQLMNDQESDLLSLAEIIETQKQGGKDD